MKKKINLKDLVELLINCISNGVVIKIDSESKVKTILVHNTLDGKKVMFDFEVPSRGWCKVGHWVETIEPVKKPEE